MTYGSLRHYFSLTAAVNPWLRQPFRPKDLDVFHLLIVGAYQLHHTRIPDHAAISETVSACARLGKPWARGLVNAVLRRCQDERDAGSEDVVSFEHPPWLDARLRDQYGPAAEALMLASNQRAPMTLRINTRRAAPAVYQARLAEAGLRGGPPSLDGTGVGPGDQAWVLESPTPAAGLPGFEEGQVAVQDAGAQFAAALLDPQPGQRVLDACAAPGGKLFHLLERHPEVQVTAIEQNPERLEHMLTEARRLGHDGFSAAAGDATARDWWDGQRFARILLDAPCSGTGTLRRHPDIKVLRNEQDVARHRDLQARLLANLWHVLEPGGSLLYCTCSVLAEENDDVIGAFLARQADARIDPIRLASGSPRQYGWQLLPTNPHTDGFYYARLRKAEAGEGADD